MGFNRQKRNKTPAPITGGKRHWFFLAGGMAFGFALGLWVAVRGHFSGSSQFPSSAHVGVPLSQNISSNWFSPKKPWGNLEFQNITMERPPEFVPELPAMALEPRWFFGNWAPSQIQALLSSSDLTETQRHALLDTQRWQSLSLIHI